MSSELYTGGLMGGTLLSEIIRLWLTLLDREHESRENHGTQNSRCKPSVPHGYGTKLWLLSRSEAKLVDGR
jgi:hypothetical protein